MSYFTYKYEIKKISCSEVRHMLHSFVGEILSFVNDEV